MLLFNDVSYIGKPSNKTNVTFSCDDIYFQKFGIENLNSCIHSGLIPHCHLINPSDNTKQEILKFNNNVSFSIEKLNIDQFEKHQLKTYYYCSRFFIARDLFDRFEVESLWICDTDVIFNQKPDVPADKKIGISYNADQESLWKQTQASLIYIEKTKKTFIDYVISEYLKKLNTIDFSQLDIISDKYERGNLIGLDQVCMSIVFNKFYKNDPTFINLHNVPNLKSKERKKGMVTILVGKNKD